MAKRVTFEANNKRYTVEVPDGLSDEEMRSQLSGLAGSASTTPAGPGPGIPQPPNPILSGYEAKPTPFDPKNNPADAGILSGFADAGKREAAAKLGATLGAFTGGVPGAVLGGLTTTPGNTGATIGGNVAQAVSNVIPGLGVLPAVARGVMTGVGYLTGDAAQKKELPSGMDVAKTMGVAAGVPAVAQGAASLLTNPGKARSLYQYALNQPPPGDAVARKKLAELIGTGLSEKVPVSSGGVSLIDSKIEAINQLVQDAVQQAAAAGKTIDPRKVMRELARSKNEFLEQVIKSPDMKTLADVRKAYWVDHSVPAPYSKLGQNPYGPGFVPAGSGTKRYAMDIPIDEAQAEKMGSYRKLKTKYDRGQIGGAEFEGTRDLIRGTKNQVYKEATPFAPAGTDLTKEGDRERRLIDLLDAVAKTNNKNIQKAPIRLRDLFSAEALGIPAAVATRLLDNPAMASRAAIFLNRPKTVDLKNAPVSSVLNLLGLDSGN